LEYAHSFTFIKLLKSLLISSASQPRSMRNILPPLGDSFFGSWIGLYLHKPQPLPFSHPSDTKQPPLLWWTSPLPKSTACWSQVSPRLELMPGISSTPQNSVDKP
jgi:hypothetical protein